jgi:hypothetical protein
MTIAHQSRRLLSLWVLCLIHGLTPAQDRESLLAINRLARIICETGNEE